MHTPTRLRPSPREHRARKGSRRPARAKARKLDLGFLKEESRQLISGILEGADRTARIVGGLRVFGRMDGDKPVEAALSDLLEASITVLGDRARSRARIEVDLVDNAPSLYCQSGKLSQVFMNIIVNAVQATESRWQDVEERKVRVELDQTLDANGKAHVVIVRVRDNGTGMDEETQQRLFDPFYTTKEIGKGTGLGLSIVKGILDDHGARIAVESRLGEGTTFVLTFPLDIMSNPNSEALTAQRTRPWKRRSSAYSTSTTRSPTCFRSRRPSAGISRSTPALSRTRQCGCSTTMSSMWCSVTSACRASAGWSSSS